MMGLDGLVGLGADAVREGGPPTIVSAPDGDAWIVSAIAGDAGASVASAGAPTIASDVASAGSAAGDPSVDVCSDTSGADASTATAATAGPAEDAFSAASISSASAATPLAGSMLCRTLRWYALWQSPKNRTKSTFRKPIPGRAGHVRVPIHVPLIGWEGLYT